MPPEDLLRNVTDRDSFIAFVEALASEREDVERLERESPTRYILGGARDWQNADISSYLGACLDFFNEKPFHTPDATPSWRMFAEFLWFGKIIE